MECISIKQTKVTLIMDEKEAKWLMNNVQNPLHGQNLNEEEASDTKLRHKLFECLNEEINDRDRSPF